MKRGRAWHAALLTVVLATAVWIRRVVMPPRPPDAGLARPRRIPEGDAKPTADGNGLRIVVNPSSGPALRGSPVNTLREGLPAADVVELSEGDDVRELLADPRFSSVGAAGGDGTLASAAGAAVDRDVTFVAVPAGTLNHLARDLGLDSEEDAVKAVRAGYALAMDVGDVDGRVFINTLSFGGYTAIVDTRERLQPLIGKWPALLLALIVQLPRMKPLRLVVDDKPMRLWLAWIGNCAYSPDGLGPLWREKLDDGLLDIRLVHGARRFSKTRFTLAVLSGRLRHCHVYSEWKAEKLEVVCLDGPQRLAADGETFDGAATFTVAKRRRALRVAVPPPG